MLLEMVYCYKLEWFGCYYSTTGLPSNSTFPLGVQQILSLQVMFQENNSTPCVFHVTIVNNPTPVPTVRVCNGLRFRYCNFDWCWYWYFKMVDCSNGWNASWDRYYFCYTSDKCSTTFWLKNLIGDVLYESAVVATMVVNTAVINVSNSLPHYFNGKCPAILSATK